MIDAVHRKKTALTLPAVIVTMVAKIKSSSAAMGKPPENTTPAQSVYGFFG